MKHIKLFDESVNEKWDTDSQIPASEKGKYNGWTLEELHAERNKLKEKRERSEKESSRLREINFAIRAKQKDKWGKIKESMSIDDAKNHVGGIIAQAGFTEDYKKGQESIKSGWDTVIKLTSNQKEKEKLARERNEALAAHFNMVLELAAAKIKKEGKVQEGFDVALADMKE